MNTSLEDSLLQQAITTHQLGNLQDAEAIYQQVLLHNPNNIQSLNMLGVVALQKEQPTAAMSFFKQVLRLDNANQDAHCNLGNAYQCLKRYQEAIDEFDIALTLTTNQLGIMLNKCECQRQMGNNDDALNTALALSRLAPDNLAGWFVLGNVLSEQLQYAEAIDAYQKALTIDPKSVDTYCNLGLTYKTIGNLPQAEHCYQSALTYAPDNTNVLNNYGVLLKERGELEIASNIFQRCCDINPNFDAARINLGDAYYELGLFKHSIKQYQTVLAHDENNSLAHFGLAFSLLITGDFSAGWDQYQWRDLSRFIHHYKKFYPNKPIWRGESLLDKRIVILSEQGFGDNIQFIRLIELIRMQGTKIIITAPKELASLLQSFDDTIEIFSDYHAIPDHDYFCPLLHLPFLLNVQEDSIPHTVPYLSPANADTTYWQTIKETHGIQALLNTHKLNVGLVWAGSSANLSDHKRSIPQHCLLPLLNNPKANFFSLQLGQVLEPEIKDKLFDLSPYINNFSQTAAMIQDLDLVICVCTSVAHLAGAMGKPVWLMLAQVADWRWLRETEDSPWYPSAKLYRQTERGDWDSVMKTLASDLAEKINFSQ